MGQTPVIRTFAPHEWGTYRPKSSEGVIRCQSSVGEGFVASFCV